MLTLRTQKSIDPLRPVLSILPVELIIIILQHLDGRNLQSARLVCKDWEAITRPYFASRHLSRSVFWLTSSSLQELDMLSRKFGPHMRKIYIASNRFNFSGLFAVFKQYLYDRRATIKSSKHDRKRGTRIWTQHSILDINTFHLGRFFTQNRWRYHAGGYGNWKFFCHYMYNMASQYFLRVSGQDLARLSAILGRMPHCEARIVTLNYAIGKLQSNCSLYGKPAPRYAFQLVLFSARVDNDIDLHYTSHVEQVIEEAKKIQKSSSGRLWI